MAVLRCLDKAKFSLVFTLPLPELFQDPVSEVTIFIPQVWIRAGFWLVISPPGKRWVLGCVPQAAPSPEDAPGWFSFHCLPQ